MGPLAGTRISYKVERQIWLDYCVVEVGQFQWPCPVEHVLKFDDDVFAFNLALSPRPPRVMISHLDDASSSVPESLGRVLLINPGCAVRMIVPSGQVRSLYCGIQRRKLEQFIGRRVDFDDHRWRMDYKARAPVIELLLNRVYEELWGGEFAAELAIDSYANALCIQLARCFLASKDGRADSHKGGLAPWRMRLLRERIHADAPAPCLSELADLCGITVRQVSRAFKAETGKTLGKYIGEVIVERAIRLLAESDCPITEIAVGLGFATSASFTHSFCRLTGLRPSELRRRGRRGGLMQLNSTEVTNPDKI